MADVLCFRRLATPDGRTYCRKPAKFLYRWNRGEGEWIHVCARHARVTPSYGERMPLLAQFTDADINAEAKRRNPPPPNPQAPTMKEPTR